MGPVVLTGGGDRAVPPISAVRLLTQSTLRESWWLAVLVALAAGLYAYGAHRMRSRGDRWPVLREAMFGLGLIVIAVALLSGLAAYDETVFSVHMVQHMLLIMVAPIFLAIGAPVTLALRTLPRRPRRWLLAVLHSGLAKVIAFPVVGFALFTLSSFGLYFSGWYEATLRSSALHALLHLHFLLVGSLFFWPLVGLDPVPGRVAYPFRLLVMVAAMPFHAILGLTIMQSRNLIAGDYYRSLHLSWLDPVADQQLGGGVLWASGELVTLLMLGALFVQWMRASEREAARIDRQLDRLEAEQAARAGLDPG